MHNINLLPRHQSAASFSRSLKRLGETVIICAGIALVLGTGWLKMDKQKTISQIQEKTAEKKQVKEAIDRSNALQQQLTTIVERKSALLKLQEQHPSYSKLLQDLALATPATVQLAGITLDTKSTFSVSGTAASQESVNSLIANLNGSTSFGNAILNQTTNQEGGVSFGLTVSLKSGSESKEEDKKAEE